MKKLNLTILLITVLTAFSIPKLNAQCSVDGYVGNDGTSCAYIGSDGCSYIVYHHRILFGLFRWNTVEQVSCAD